ncbi:Leucine zipper transcription factor-like protein 1 [Tritrichomonas musculus]|uniref:Leucine zipper transcription factor-like protein 1 n=1 Tax=Tritrichomonas musculus TaxID=1915356 RepID=A0ABR2HHW9_9EUKA
MSELGEYTQEQLSQLVEFLLFEQQKRKETRTEISGELSDLLQEQIESETLYSGKDCLELLEKLPSSLKKTVSTELERNRDLSVVLFERIFQQAQDAHIVMELNVPELDMETATDEANLLCGQILLNKDKISKGENLNSPPKKEEPEEDVEAIQKEIEQLQLENEKLKEQLKKPKREWKEFKETNDLLKARNAEYHDLQKQLNVNE